MTIVHTKPRRKRPQKPAQLLKDREMAKGAQGNPGGQGARIVQSQPATAQPLSDLGISKTQSSRWQKLADIPEPDFEATFAKPEKPTTAGLIAAHAKKTEAPVIEAEIEPPPRRAARFGRRQAPHIDGRCWC